MTILRLCIDYTVPSPKIQRWIVLPDPHIPVHDTKAVAAIESLMKDYRFDGWICLGDLMDFNCISSHNLNNLRAVEGQRIQSDYKIAAKFLDSQATILRKKTPAAKMILLEGNHGQRILRYIDAHPQLEGMIEIPNALELERRKIEWVPCWSKGDIYKVGKASFGHGRYISDGHAKKHVTVYGTSFFYGHTHSVDSYSLTRHGSQTPIGQSLGHLCLPQAYMQGTPDKWQTAFAVFDFLPSGEFQHQFIRINNHQFVYNNKIYGG
jgi:hypothetical protein